MGENSLDKLVLKSGLKASQIHKNKLFPDYTLEILGFNKDLKKKRRKLPFENHEKSLLQGLRYINSQSPYVVFVGEPGIGKTLMLEYMVNVITQEIPLKKVAKDFPKAVNLFKDIISKKENFEQKDYLFLPNLRNPNLVKPIVYDDHNVSENDYDVAYDFSVQISEIFNDFIEPNRKKIKKIVPKDQLNNFLKSETYSLMNQVYAESINLNLRFFVNKEKEFDPIPIIDINYNPNTKNELEINYEIVGDMNFQEGKKKTTLRLNDYVKRISGFNEDRQNITITDFEQGLSNTYLTEYVKREIEYINSNLQLIDVNEYPLSELQKSFSQVLNSTSKQLSENLKKEQKKNSFKDQFQQLQYIIRKNRSEFFMTQASTNSVKELYYELDDLFEKYEYLDITTELKDWMKDSIKFFKTEKKFMQDVFTKELIKQDNDRYTKHEKQKYFSRVGKQTEKGKTESTQDQEEAPENDVFCIAHGDNEYQILDLFQPLYFNNKTNNSKKLSWAILSNLDSESIFAKFYDSSEQPPHRRIASKGSLFKNSIMVIPDQFHKLIEIFEDNEKSNINKDQFLEYLQTGVVTMESEGVVYKIPAPRMILACDNQNPFQTNNGFMVKEETGLEDRIKTIHVPDAKKNTAEVREGTLRVLTNVIEEYNYSNSKKLKIKADAMNFLLQSGLDFNDTASLKYRKIKNKIEDLCNYISSENHKTITTDRIKNWVKSNFNDEHFSFVDDSKETYFESPDKRVGSNNGLFVSGSTFGFLSINSYVNYPFSKNNFNHFELIESSSEMTGNMLKKGYMYAIDYISNLLMKTNNISNLREKSWQVKTHFKNLWNDIDGPSASMAIAMSIVSAMGDDDLYKNRFVSGTIDPQDGNCNSIGGVYYKALVPYRLQELSMQKDEDFYFLFPVDNLREFSHSCNIDAFDINKNITSYPISTINQAYHLLTCGPKITEEDWKHSEEIGKEKVYQAVNKFSEEIKSNI